MACLDSVDATLILQSALTSIMQLLHATLTSTDKEEDTGHWIVDRYVTIMGGLPTRAIYQL